MYVLNVLIAFVLSYYLWYYWSMDRYDIFEFSKIYKRVLDVETTLKQKLYNALLTTYPKNEFSRLIPYIQKQLPHKKYIQNGRDRINDIIGSNKIQTEKLAKFLRILYLIDVLNILTEYSKIRKDKRFRLNFYNTNVDMNIVKKNASAINSLRNTIMHFDIANYQNNKQEWLSALAFWEKVLCCQNMKPIHEISPIRKLNVNGILTSLANCYPDLFKLSDRLVCDMFDDIAFINGWEIKDLPEYWTIVRTLYNIKRKYKKTYQTPFEL